jgi:signal transduction histidine kinase
VWFGTLNGVARFTPPARLSGPPRARILLAGVRVSGVALPFSAMGQDRIDGVVLAPNQGEIEIDVIGLPRVAAASLQLQYRRSSAERWSLPSANRTLTLAGLSDGSYRYEIRAVGRTGLASSNTVVVAFRVLAPIYRRPWFLALAAAAVFALAVSVYRARVAHLVALERLRTQIAMDLHDEMGSGLGSIGLLADVGAQRCRGGAEAGGVLDQIGEVASEMGSSLSDIVWSLREDEMTVESLGRHLAERGRRLFPDAARAFQCDFPSVWPHDRMSPGARRNAFLVGLEALHNAARHSGAKRVTLGLQPLGRRWHLVVADDGMGMDNGGGERPRGGFGLDGMKRRAAVIGATLDVQSQCGAGTTVSLVFDPRAERRDARLI